MAIRKAEQVYLEALLEICSSFEDELSQLSRQDYPSSGPQAIIRSIARACGILTRQVESIIAKSKEIIDGQEDLIAEAASIFTFIEFFKTHVCPILRNSTTENVPSELVRPFQRLADIVFPGCILLISAVPENNYYFTEVSPRIKEFFELFNLEKVLDEEGLSSRDLFHLQISTSPPCNILSHCLLGHEIGHAAFRKYQVDERIVPQVHFDEAEIERTVDAVFASVIASSLPTQIPQQLFLQQGREFWNYFIRMQMPAITVAWIEELFSDLFGTALFGPSYICALCILLLPFADIDIPSDSHPPSRLRIQACITALKRSDPGFGYKDLARYHSDSEYICMIRPWEEVVGKVFRRPTDSMYKPAFKSIVSMKSEIVEEVKNSLGENKYSYAQFYSEVPRLRERLREWLPPNEYLINSRDEFEIPSVQGIFNAGWLSYLEDIDVCMERFQHLSEIELKKKYYQLLLKGLELSEVQKRWTDS